MVHLRLLCILKTCLAVNLVVLLITILILLKTLLTTTHQEENILPTAGNYDVLGVLANNLDDYSPKRDANGMRTFHVFRRLPEIEPEKKTRRKYNTNDDEHVIPNDKLAIDEVLNAENGYNNVVFKQSPKNMKQKIVHLDLKGAPPKMEYLISLMSLLQRVGATGLLVEYEDMFPYDGEIKMISATNAYTKAEIISFLEAAKKNDLAVIPLVQTFGHLEYVLKLAAYRELREVDAQPDSICPSNPRSLEIIQLMIDQIIKMHSQVQEVEWLHIGCDEVYHMNKCDKCLKRNSSSKSIFVDHVTFVAKYVKSIRPNLEILVWDDMFRSFTPDEMKDSGLGSLVQPVVWIYSSSITKLVPHRIWYLYTTIFKKIWVASAFKGASGPAQVLPDLRSHYENHLSWLNFTATYKIPGTTTDYIFQGIFLTGWSRYKHFSVLCETLPVSLPSLLLNLLLVNIYLGESKLYRMKKKSLHELDVDVFQRWKQALHCPNRKEFHTNLGRYGHNYLSRIEEFLPMCEFNGKRLYNDVNNLILLESNSINFHVLYTYKTNGLYEYNINHKTVNLFNHDDVLEKAKRLDGDIKTLSRSLQRHLMHFFDNSTVEEFMELKIQPIKKIIQRISSLTGVNAVTERVWDRRPYKPVED